MFIFLARPSARLLQPGASRVFFAFLLNASITVVSQRVELSRTDQETSPEKLAG
jgi:hypothetical protein